MSSWQKQIFYFFIFWENQVESNLKPPAWQITIVPLPPHPSSGCPTPFAPISRKSFLELKDPGQKWRFCRFRSRFSSAALFFRDHPHTWFVTGFYARCPSGSPPSFTPPIYPAQGGHSLGLSVFYSKASTLASSRNWSSSCCWSRSWPLELKIQHERRKGPK